MCLTHNDHESGGDKLRTAENYGTSAVCRPGCGNEREGLRNHEAPAEGLPGLHKVNQCAFPHRINESVGDTKQFFKLIFFIKLMRQNNTTSLLETDVALTQLD
jgi:hypothetical protein